MSTCPHGAPIEGQIVPEGAALKTWCGVCSVKGSEQPVFDHAMVTELANLGDHPVIGSRVDAIMDAIVKYQTDLGLSNWTLFVGEEWPEDNKTDDAFVVRQPAELHAIIHVHPDQPDSQVERLVVHELLHLAHARLDGLGNNGQSTGVMEAYDRELELFLNTMATALTGIAWKPVGEWAERFEVEGDTE